MSTFIDSAEALMRRLPEGNDLASFQRVFQAWDWLSRALAKGSLDLDNLEAVYGAFEMCSLLERSPSKDFKAAQLPDDLAKVIVLTLQDTVRHPDVHRRGPESRRSPGEYDVLRKAIQQAEKQGNSVSILTFNYDLCIEHMASAMNRQVGYGLNEQGGNLQIYKLHGSMNWINDGSGSIQVIPFREVVQYPTRRQGEDDKELRLDIFAAAKISANINDAVPFIVPPTFSKGSRYEQIGQVWQRAARALQHAEHIRFVGYSLPPSDYFFNTLFSVGTISATRIKSIVAIDVDKSGETERRYRKMLGPLAERRFRYIDKGFTKGLLEVENMTETFEIY